LEKQEDVKDWKFLLEKYLLRKHPPSEPQVWKELARIRGELFVDVGANVGTYSTRLSSHFRRVYAFEPNPNILPILKERVDSSSRQNITVFPMALSDVNGHSEFYIDRHEGFVGSVETLMPVFNYNPGFGPGTGPAHKYVGKENVVVSTATYDSKIREVADLVKIDVEGAEFNVLRGAKDALTNGRIKRIMVELHDKNATEELFGILAGYGFKLKLLDPHPRIFGSLS
jgi:FkbM family methyltransferase